MKKIKTIFERDWNGNGKILNEAAPGVSLEMLDKAVVFTATEKLDGMNVRLTIRNHGCYRLEKRRNPDKIQKQKGVTEPWYVDADQYSPDDKYLYEALAHTDLSDIPDGEWPGEALGPNIQGNPLKLEQNTICLFSCGKAPIFEDVPTSYEALREWLPKQKSKFGNDVGIEGIVWHGPDGEMYKIKTKDF